MVNQQSITPNSSIESLRKIVGSTVNCTSEKRRRYLQRLAAINTGIDLKVKIVGKTAKVTWGQDGEILDNEKMFITIPSDIPSQKVTNFEPSIWELLVQKTQLYHEIGHILYTDWPSFLDLWNSIDSEHENAYERWSNIAEDAAIERILTHRFDIEEDLKIKNENLLRANEDASVLCDVSTAVTLRLMEYKFPIGWIGELLDSDFFDWQFEAAKDHDLFVDEIDPILKDRMPDIKTENDPVKRNEKFHELFEEIIPLVDSAERPGLDNMESFGTGWDTEQAENGGSGKIFVPATGGSGSGFAGGGGEENEPIESEYGEEIEKERNERQITSLGEWSESLEASPEDEPEIIVPTAFNYWEEGTYQSARKLSSVYARELDQTLRQERRTRKKSGQRFGRIDSRSMHKSQFGNPNIFKRTARPDEKNYAAVVILDRSSSMGGTISYNSSLMRYAEEAAGAATIAFEEVGIDVCQLSILSNDVHLEKDFSQSSVDQRKIMFRGKSAGGTPLHKAISVAHDRVRKLGKQPFILIVTDGRPGQRSVYRSELRKCNLPVLGVYISEDSSFDSRMHQEAEYYHRLDFREPSECFDGVRNLTRRVMF